jgi:AcrR family transcriptional regulator
MAAARKTAARRRAGTARMAPGARRDQLLDVAGEILGAEGVRGLTMERLAERAGVSKGLGYAYFGDAEAVALALFEREVEALYQRIREATTGATRFEDGLRRAIAAYFDVVAERGVLLGALQAHLTRERAERRTRRSVAGFVAFWSRQLGTALALEPPAAETLAAMLLSAADACGRMWRAGRISRAQAERLCTDFALAGARGAAGGGPRRQAS